MAKLTDGSEKIRIKTSMAVKLRAKAKDLDMSFLDLVYYALNYYLEHGDTSKTKVQSLTTAKVEVEQEDDCELDLNL